MNVSCPECGSVFRVDPAKVPQAGVRARCSICGGVIAIGKSGVIDEDFASPSHAMAAVGAGAAAGRAERAPGGRATDQVRAAPTPPSPSAPPLTAPTPRVQPPLPPPQVGRPDEPRVAHTPVATPREEPRIGPAAPTPPIVPPLPATPPAAASRVTPGPPATSAAPVAHPSAPTPPAPRPAAPPPLPATPPSTPAARPSASPPPPAIAPTPPAAQRASGGATRAPINPFLANDPNQKAKRLARALISDIIAYHPDKHAEALRGGTLKEQFREEIKKSYEEYVDQMGREFAEATTHFQDALNDVLAGGRKVF